MEMNWTLFTIKREASTRMRGQAQQVEEDSYDVSVSFMGLFSLLKLHVQLVFF